MAIIPVQKHKHRDGASNPDTSSRGDTEDTVKKKKRKMINLDVMYMGSGDAEGTPKRQKRKVDSEDVESDPIIPSKKSGDGYIEKATDQETYKKKKKKRKDESHKDDASSSIVLNQECNEKIKKAKNSERLHGNELFSEETSCRENTDLEGKEKKRKKTKKDCGVHFLNNSLVEDLSSVQTHHTNKKRKDGGDLQCEEVDEIVDQSERAVKKKKRKEESHQEADDTAANDASYVLPIIKKKKKCKDGGDLQSDDLTEEVDESVDQSERAVKKKKKRKEESHQEAGDTAADDASYILPMSKKKKKKWKDGGDFQCEEVDESVDQSERAVNKKKKKKRKEESHQEADDTAADDASYILPMIKKKKKWKDGGDLQDDGFAERCPSHRKSPDGSDAPEQVDECLDQVEKPKKKKRKDESDQEVKDIEVDDGAPSVVLYREQNEKIKKIHKKKDTKGCKETSEQVDQSETAVKKKKKKRKEEPHQETDDIAADDGASSIVYQEKNKTTKKSHKDTKRRHGDGLPEEALYEEPADTTDKQSLKKNKKDRCLEEELLISETQHIKKKKKQKTSGDLQDDGFTEKLPSHRKSSNGSDAPEQVDECLDQVEKPIKKKKKRKDETHQEAEDRAVDDGASSIGLHEDEPSYSEPNDKDDRLSQRKKKKAKKVHLERPLEDSSVDELLDHHVQRTNKKKELKGGRDESHRQHGYTETTEQGVETEDQTEVQVKKKAKNKKHLDRSEETSEIFAEETQPEVGQSLQSRVLESDGNVKDTEQTPTSVQGRPQTSTSTDTDLNPATQDNKSPATSGKYTKERKGKQQSKQPFIRKQDLELIKEYFPQVKEGDVKMKFILSQELERIRIAKQQGIMFRSGQFTIEEDEQIKKNVEKFMAEVGIDSPVMLFHPYYFPEQLKTINALKRKFRFSQRIADGLYRSCDDAVARGSLLYRFATSTGRFSEQEVKELKKYHEEHGDDYMAISKLMSRTVVSAQRKISDMNNEVNRGPWSVEETNLLISAVKEFVLDSLRKENKSDEEPVTVPKRKLYKGIKWVQIEKKVVTRNWTHCKARWSNVISTRMNSGFHPCKGDQGRLTNMKMIQWMREADVKDYGDVKWDKLCDDIGNVTSFCAQLNFVALKQSVEGWKSKRLYEIVDFLYEVTLPRLEYQLSSAALEEPEKKEEFLISEMFREYSEFE